MRVYPLDPRELTQEQIAVTFAMTSRRPEAFDQIRQIVSETKAADFNEKWVVGYGHASVAEHAVIHMAVEDISRLVCDDLEDNRLASYTEKSSRYQVLDRGSFHVPLELRDHALKQTYVDACKGLFDAYYALIEQATAHLRSVKPQREGERDRGYKLRLQREATDSCRFVLPASTLTNVGVTMNARTLEHAITKLVSSELAEARELGARLKKQGQGIAPTLVKYADVSDYLIKQRQGPSTASTPAEPMGPSRVSATLLEHDKQAEVKLATAMLFRADASSYEEARRKAEALSQEARGGVVEAALAGIGPFDSPPRELELVEYLFELEMDYGAYREYKRHRMQTYLPQPLTVERGYVAPPLLAEAGAAGLFEEAMGMAARAHVRMAELSPAGASYVVTHAHNRRLLVKINLRECYHLLKLRTAAQAHFTIRELCKQILERIEEKHPLLICFMHQRK